MNPPLGATLEIKLNPNWPFFRPVLYHDIQNDIAPSKQPTAFRSYTLWMLTTIVYAMNLTATIALLASGEPKYAGALGIILAVLYFFLCPIIAFFGWHFPLYKVLKSDSSAGYIGYFISFGLQMVFVFFLAIGIFNGGGGGLVGTIDMFHGKHYVPAALSLACTIVLVGFFVYGIIQLRDVSSLYKNGGHSIDKARNEMLQSVASNPRAMNALFTGASSSKV